MEILQLLSKGYGNQAIAQELSLSLNTVKRYMANIFDKLKANSRTEAVINAQRAGIIHIADVN
jgi:DNA-binding NarL/FixJ family response regulator